NLELHATHWTKAGRKVGALATTLAVDVVVAAGDDLARTSLADGAFGNARAIDAFGGERAQLSGVVVDELDGEGLGADEVEQDLEDDLRQLAQLHRRVQLERRHVEVGEVVILALDVVIAIVDVAVELLDAGEARHERLALALELLDARDQLAQG